jgi:anti-sigma factor (TIGR02949 family)
MSCENVQERISSILDRNVRGEEREKMLAHIESCRDCSARLEFQQQMRGVLRRMDREPIPAQLTAKLRVLASHERERRLARATFSARLRTLSDRISLLFDNLMRPLALPFAGGLASSALIIFGFLVPSLTFSHAYADQALFTYADGEVVVLAPNGGYMAAPESANAPRIERADADTPEVANVVELTICQSGRVCDWSVASGELTPDLTNIIMFGQFSPATNLGMPISGKVKAVQIRSIQTPPIRVRS